MSSAAAKEGPSDGGRGGIKFGTDVAYDDAYGADPSSLAGTGGDDDDKMVTSLPTLEEERRLLGEDDFDEEDDEGRVAGASGGRGGSHPSTMAARARQAEDAGRGDDVDPFANAAGGSGLVNTRIADRDAGTYRARRNDRVLREDGVSYKEAMESANLERERRELIEEARKELVDEDTGEFKKRLDGDAGGSG
eukprot:CAMPEP_0172527168 /NCGR_PEP_ID=MMETSP1067-20121228/1922_1 /TAXON_ID=265564 ORGANISM="Thalassiosira punctigera, Strain Tpunct2005C2" /NCGR_SAMPLE_ID=MMETSP1067 /ASSEMBLY_ACC=CAM_ASM_000444 /LENGTH=192 /DNA_ID=CAMNT_0013310847 /DNA_START=137 /DNA_END=712 /DNA_ORIENTATION=-